MLMKNCLPAVRLASRSAIKAEMKKIGPSRGPQVAEIQKRLVDYQRLPKTIVEKYEVDSILSEKLIQNNTTFDPVLKRREESSAKTEKEDEIRQQISPFYPLSSSHYDITEDITPKPVADDGEEAVDRGFFIEAGRYVDEYTVGTSENLADDEMLAPDRVYYGDDDAVEHMDFQLPGQNIHGHEKDTDPGESSIEWNEQHGSADPNRPASKHSCSGCGAQIHCKDSSLPGFLPVEVFDKKEKIKNLNESILCKRCHLLKNHNFLLNVNVCPVDYSAMMSHLKLKEEALILLVVDVTDLPGSIHRHLPDIIGTRKPIIVIGNKVDLLPPDARVGYLKQFRDTVQRAVEDHGFRRKFNILHTALVSAKTGYGVEDLITEIHLKWTNVRHELRNDMYIVGCTNAGKSTLFNAFLDSDLCKVRAVDLVERATTSVWPGTTISLLKFPVMKPSPYRLEVRRRRLQKQKAWEQKEMYARKLLLQDTGDSKYAVLTGLIQNTYKEEEENLQPVAIKDIISGQEKQKSWDANDPLFAKGTWCFDTPGTVCDDQVISLFTLDELVKVLPRRLLVPRTALVPVGSSLLIGGVGRIDVLSTRKEHAVYLTTFASNDLPLNIMKTEEVDDFFKKYLGTKALVVPMGGERLKDWPGLSGKDYTVFGYKRHEIATADIVLSSIGWVSVTTRDQLSTIKAWSVGGKGLAFREPILPYSASLRGNRMPGTYFYKVKPLDFPVNTRRLIAQKKKFRKYK